MFIQKTLEELLDDFILVAASQKENPLTDFSKGSTAYTLARAFMSVLARGYIDLDEALISSFISTATGDYLTRHADAFGVTRNTGTFSKGGAIAIAKTGARSTSIPAGTLTLTDGTKLFRNTSDLIISPPNTKIPIQAVAIGNAYDLPAGTVLSDTTGLLNGTWDFKVATNGLDASGNPIGFLTGGSDPETDEELRARFIEFINSLSRGTERAVKAAIAGVPGVESYILKEFDPGVGWFTVYVDDGSDVTDPVLLSNVRAALQKTKAAGIAYRVLGMQKQFVNMSITLTIDGNFSPKYIIDTAKAQLQKTINSYTFGNVLTLSKIISICMSVPGVIAVRVSNPTGDINPGSSTAVRAGILTINAVV